VKDYCNKVNDNGLERYRGLRYAFGFFADGTPIPDWARIYYRSDPKAQTTLGMDPFATGLDYFTKPWGGNGQPLITKAMHALWELRPDLKNWFPDPEGASRAAFVQHFLRVVIHEENVPDPFLAPAFGALPRSKAPWGLRLRKSRTVQRLRTMVRPLLRI